MLEFNPRRLIILAVIAALSVLIPVLYPIVRQHYREIEARQKVQENMKQLGNAILRYEAQHPEAAKNQTD